MLNIWADIWSTAHVMMLPVVACVVRERREMGCSLKIYDFGVAVVNNKLQLIDVDIY